MTVIGSGATPGPGRSWMSELGRQGESMITQIIIVMVIVLLVFLFLRLSVRVVQQYERGVHFRLGKVIGVREPGMRIILPIMDVLTLESLRSSRSRSSLRASSRATT